MHGSQWHSVHSPHITYWLQQSKQIAQNFFRKSMCVWLHRRKKISIFIKKTTTTVEWYEHWTLDTLSSITYNSFSYCSSCRSVRIIMYVMSNEQWVGWHFCEQLIRISIFLWMKHWTWLRSNQFKSWNNKKSKVGHFGISMLGCE